MEESRKMKSIIHILLLGVAFFIVSTIDGKNVEEKLEDEDDVIVIEGNVHLKIKMVT